jgi:hypothetical protein
MKLSTLMTLVGSDELDKSSTLAGQGWWNWWDLTGLKWDGTA